MCEHAAVSCSMDDHYSVDFMKTVLVLGYSSLRMNEHAHN